MSTKDKTNLLMVMLNEELETEILNFQETHKIRGRNEAIRTLIKKGLKATIE